MESVFGKVSDLEIVNVTKNRNLSWVLSWEFEKMSVKWFGIVSSLSRGRSRTAATSKMKRFVIIVNGFQPLTIITKRPILDAAAVLDPPVFEYLLYLQVGFFILHKKTMMQLSKTLLQNESSINSLEILDFNTRE